MCFTIVPEVPNVRLWGKTGVGIATTYNMCEITAIFLNQARIDPIDWDLERKGGFGWAAFAGLDLL